MTSTPKYTSMADLKVFAARIDSITVEQKIILTGYVLAAGLMLPRGITANITWFLTKLGAKIHSRHPQLQYTAVLQHSSKGGEIAKDTILQTREWMLKGNDQTDPRSAGGFNRQELAKLVHAVENIRSGKTVLA
ncbi:MAG: hypothetical protein CL472_06550 [Acidobacteria bacterium]|nr:hypothetical protein [Acidobacteriota bacterium]|tara:strand:+ start:170 stop:571 length:402 start_codon:yes stop_codon:yes gene_type:complete